MRQNAIVQLYWQGALGGVVERAVSSGWQLVEAQ